MLRVAMRTLDKEVEDDHILRNSIRFDPRQIADWLKNENNARAFSQDSAAE